MGLLAALPATGLGATDAPPGPKPQRLFIVLDAVPYSLMAELTDPARGEEALFRDLRGPAPLVSTFPASTSVAMGGLLGPFGLRRSPGYEARFFDWSKRRARGGGPVSYGKIEFPWRNFFDWNRRGVIGSFVEALRPVHSGTKRLRKALKAFRATDRELYTIYIAATDIAVHLNGPRAVERLLVSLDEMLRELRAERPDRPFEVVFFSDHGIAGGEALRNVYRPLKRALKERGLKAAKRLRRPHDVVLTPFGLVSSFEAYVEPGREPAATAALAAADGVDLCVHPAETGWAIVDRDGQARLERRSAAGTVEWRYQPADGDPLGYRPLLDRLRTAHGGDWIPDGQWLEASMESQYPDAFHRLTRAFDLVLNPASIVCSLAPGHMYGAAKTQIASRLTGRLRWTHGALERDSTLGFLMSDVAGWQPPPAARFDTALLPFLPDRAPTESSNPSSHADPNPTPNTTPNPNPNLAPRRRAAGAGGAGEDPAGELSARASQRPPKSLAGQARRGAQARAPRQTPFSPSRSPAGSSPAPPAAQLNNPIRPSGFPPSGKVDKLRPSLDSSHWSTYFQQPGEGARAWSVVSTMTGGEGPTGLSSFADRDPAGPSPSPAAVYWQDPGPVSGAGSARR